VAFEKIFHGALRLDEIPNWADRVDEPLTDRELKSIRNRAQRGAILGDETWVESIAHRLKLESTKRPRERPLPEHNQNQEI
jgi:putative transposase